MKRLAIGLAFFLLLPATFVRAEKPMANNGLGLNNTVAAGELKATPEMWFYDQAMRRYNDPKFAVRENAAARAMQRERRLEARQWFGLSNSRPIASSDPFNGEAYSPHWVAGPGYYPSRWNGVNMP
ncbi:MAG: hypothetical protein LLF97_06255 [Planctomycetaceae bacterium]|nr:hypothetical protein [Planctomycetaceae bacterium]